MIGNTLSHYKIISKLGQGGMGEVYLAEDSRLDRKVALKILPQHLSDRAELRERFEREARAVSSLNHPHICTLHDIGEQDGIHYLVMEHLVGETLEARLAKGALPLEQTLEYAIQIADALDKAHRQGVVHRDLKPGNIMLVKSGAKLLDFGLAKLQAADTPTNLSALPTEQANLTAEGTILGTLQYMAPEQLEGKEADSRTDIFAFGAVVYEMATGKKAFEGKSQASLIAAIMGQDPPAMSELQPMTPQLRDWVVKRCLAKDPDERWQTAADLMEGFRMSVEGSSQPGIAAPTVFQNRTRERIFWATSLLVTIIVGALILVLQSPQDSRLSSGSTSGRFVHTIPNEYQFNGIAISPDGKVLVYAAGTGGNERDMIGTGSKLYLRRLDQFEAQVVPGTEGASMPFFSPDGQWVGFFAGSKIKRVSLADSSVINVCDLAGINLLLQGASWSGDTIVFSLDSHNGLMQVSAAGGDPEPLTMPDREKGEIGHALPHALPGGESIVFSVISQEGRNLAVLSLQTGQWRELGAVGIGAHYVSTGHLLFIDWDTLYAVPFDLDRMELAGTPTPMIDALGEDHTMGGPDVYFAVSANGSLAYAPNATKQRLVWVDRTGSIVPLRDELASETYSFMFPRLSADGSQLAVGDEEAQIWIYDFERGSRKLLTNGSFNYTPVWTPDSKRIAFGSYLPGSVDILWRAADLSDEATPLLEDRGHREYPDSWSRDGSSLVFRETSSSGDVDLGVLNLSDSSVSLITATKAQESFSRLSPDDRWLAYQSNQSGQLEVYVRPFGRPGGIETVSTNGGHYAVWSKDGSELFYFEGNSLMSVAVSTARPTFTMGTPTKLFEGEFEPEYDVSPDGQRFIMVERVKSETIMRQINIALNWFEELTKRVSMP
jgi:serine/threonine-protein kinase